MSTSLITDADLINLTRTAGLTRAIDSGSLLNIALVATFADADANFQVTNNSDPLSSGQAPLYTVTNNYKTQGEVDWDNIVNSIPGAAQVHSMRITAQTDYTGSSILSVSRVLGAIGDATGDVSINIAATLASPNAATPPVNDFSEQTDFDSATGVTSMALTSSVSEPGAILRQEWDFTDIGLYPLGYITRAQLVSLFTVQQIRIFKVGASIGLWDSSYQNASLFPPITHFSYSGTVGFTINVNNWLMEVSWELPFSWTLLTPTDPIQDGDHVEATSGGGDGVDFSQLLTASLEWTDSGGSHSLNIPTWLIFTLHRWVFVVPPLTGDPAIVHVVITSTQFTGSVDLGPLLTIFFTNATGIYTLTAGKTNDTIYDNDNGGTIDVKIPNPFWKTGFIGG